MTIEEFVRFPGGEYTLGVSREGAVSWSKNGTNWMRYCANDPIGNVDKDGQLTEKQYWKAFEGLMAGFISGLIGLNIPTVAALATTLIAFGCNMSCQNGGAIGSRIAYTILTGLTGTVLNGIAQGLALIFLAEATTIGVMCLFDDPDEPEFSE